MKKNDLIVLLAVLLFLAPFILFGDVLSLYKTYNSAYPYLMSFIKFAILATFGEVIGLRIRTGSYYEKGFGILPRAIVWGFLGISIKMAFVIFGEGAPAMLATMGVQFPTENPADILRQSGFSGVKLLAAFSVGTMLNLFFAPVFMTAHRITDQHIINTGGTLKGFFTPLRIGEIMSTVNWKTMWSFVFKQTIPMFWIPAQTLNFMLPEEVRILFAAFLGIVLGVLLAFASLLDRRKNVSVK